MSDRTIEKIVTNAIHTAFIKYPEGDGGANLDYEWIAPEQSAHVTKAIILELAANGFRIVRDLKGNTKETAWRDALAKS